MRSTLPVFIVTIILGGILSFGSYAKSPVTVNAVPDAVEFAALKAIYDNLGGAGWTNKTNWPVSGNWPTSATSAQFGTWFGVTVTNGDITKIVLPNNKLVGAIPSEIGSLQSLNTINLYNNRGITGSIPTSIGQISSLQYVYLYSCSLTGTIPSSLFDISGLQWVSVADNKLTGSIPANIGNATALTYIGFHANDLTGTIPSSICNLVNLTGLYLYENALTGGIPSNIGNLSKLVNLWLYTNQLTGDIPSSLWNITSLVDLRLSTNQLTGVIPSSVKNLANLQTFTVHTNRLSGPIPSEIGNLSKLVNLYLYNNQFTGTIPSSIGNLVNLVYFQIHNNKLTGSLPSSLVNLTKVKYFYVNDNQLTGTIPAGFSALNQMVTFYIYNNQFSGELPATVFNGWTKVTAINISNNQFTGAFPSSISTCTALASINALKNQLTSLPAGLLSLPVFNSTNFSHNELTSLPDFTTHVNKANLYLNVSYNRLDFGTLQPLVGAGFRSLILTPQKNIQDVFFVTPAIGTTLTIPGRAAGSNGTITWETQQSSGNWSGVNNQNQGSTSTNYVRNAFAASDEGIYRIRMTNTSFAGVTIVSEPIKVKTAINLANWVFQYKYDGRRRLTHKKVPGADWVYMVYDGRDRLVLTQDGNQRSGSVKEWTFTKYDALNRPVLTGILKDINSLDQAGMQDAVDDYYGNMSSDNAWYETFEGSDAMHGYTNKSFPRLAKADECLTVRYYDDYAFTSLSGGGDWMNYDKNQLTASNGEVGQREFAFDRVNDLVTGTKVKNLGDNKWLLNIYYYDDRYRVIQSISQTQLTGVSTATNVYDFAGKVIRTKTVHTTLAAQPVSVVRKYTYDNMGRQRQLWHTVNSNTMVLLSEHRYNSIGNTSMKKLYSVDNGATFHQQLDYGYNIRGWLTNINSANLAITNDGPQDYFGLELGYENDLGIGPFSPNYNGNISSAKWSSYFGIAAPSGEPSQRAYIYSYDSFNRLLKGNYFLHIKGWTPSSSYEESINYDLSGNITSLVRNDEQGRVMDQLNYSYDEESGRLLSVTDQAILNKGFKDGNRRASDFDYDPNGNVIADRNKLITSIKFNSYLNLTEEVNKQDGETTKNIYRADGIKLAQEIYEPGSGTPKKRMDYVGPFLYEDASLKSIQHAEGNAIAPSADSQDQSFEYQYQIKDHLDNIRLTFTTKTETSELKATMEDSGLANASNPRVQEMENFNNLFETEMQNVSQWLNHTSSNSGNAIYLDGSPNRTVGPYTILKVYPGDKVRMKVYAKYENNTGAEDMPVETLLSLLFAPLNTAVTGEGGTITSTGFNDYITGYIAGKGDSDPKPSVDLNYIYFDKDLNIIEYQYDRIDASAGFDPGAENTTEFDELYLEKVASQIGYIYIYVSNETSMSRAWLDDLTITYERSPIVQFEDYYPFGLSMAGTAFRRGEDTYKGMVTTNGTGLNDLGFRQYDPAVGRFYAVDPLAELQLDLSTYQYAANNPVSNIDVLGLNANDEKKKPRKPKKPKQNRGSQARNGKRVKVVYNNEGKKSDPRTGNNSQAGRSKQKTNNKKDSSEDANKKAEEPQTASTSGQAGQNDQKEVHNDADAVNPNQEPAAKNAGGAREVSIPVLDDLLNKSFGPSRGKGNNNQDPNGASPVDNNRKPRYEGNSDSYFARENGRKEIGLSVVRDNNVVQGSDDPEQLNDELASTHPINEARALLFNGLAKDNSNTSEGVLSADVRTSTTAAENSSVPEEDDDNIFLIEAILDALQDANSSGGSMDFNPSNYEIKDDPEINRNYGHFVVDNERHDVHDVSFGGESGSMDTNDPSVSLTGDNSIHLAFKTADGSKVLLNISVTNVRDIRALVKRTGVNNNVIDQAVQQIISALRTEIQKANPDNDQLNELVGMLEPDDLKQLSNEDKVVVLQALTSGVEVGDSEKENSAINIIEGTTDENVADLHDKLVNTQVGDQRLIVKLVNRVSDSNPYLSDKNYARLTRVLTNQFLVRIAVNPHFKPNNSGAKEPVSFDPWEGRYSKDLPDDKRYNYHSVMDKNGKITITRTVDLFIVSDETTGWFPDPTEPVVTVAEYDNPLSDAALVNPQEGSKLNELTGNQAVIGPVLLLHYDLDESVNDEVKYNITSGVNLVSLGLSAYYLGSAEGLVFYLGLVETGATIVNVGLDALEPHLGNDRDLINATRNIVTIVEMGAGVMALIKETAALRSALRSRSQTVLDFAESNPAVFDNLVPEAQLSHLQSVDGAKELLGLPATNTKIEQLPATLKAVANSIDERLRLVDVDDNTISIFTRKGGVVNKVAEIERVNGTDVLDIVDTRITDKIDEDELLRLETDVLEEPTLLRAIGEEPELTDAWTVLDDAQVEDAVRRKSQNLSIVADFLKKYPEKEQALKVALNDYSDGAEALLVATKTFEDVTVIKTTNDLKAVLKNVTELNTVGQLEQKGIKAFFRGTTRNATDGSLYPGNPNSQLEGLPTSTDPVRATIFAIESATENPGFNGVLQIGLPEDLRSLSLASSSRRVEIELEAPIKTSAENFSTLSQIEISVDDARRLVKEVFNIDLPSRITQESGESLRLLRELEVSSPAKSFEFYQKAIPFNTK
jgi:RHS repeat-associated protein